MLLALALATKLQAQPQSKPIELSLDTAYESARKDWAQRYVSIDGKSRSAVRLTRNGSGYLVSGMLDRDGIAPEPVGGSFTPSIGRAGGKIQLSGPRHSWRGAWNVHLGCFELSGDSQPTRIKLWQQRKPMRFRFLQDHAPLEKPHDVPDNLMGGPTDTEALYAFPALAEEVIRSADQELLGAGWKKSLWPAWYYEKEVVYTVYYEPGPSGRVIDIEPGTSRPESHAASDLVEIGTHRSGWVGMTVSGPKVHG